MQLSIRELSQSRVDLLCGKAVVLQPLPDHLDLQHALDLLKIGSPIQPRTRLTRRRRGRGQHRLDFRREHPCHEGCHHQSPYQYLEKHHRSPHFPHQPPPAWLSASVRSCGNPETPPDEAHETGRRVRSRPPRRRLPSRQSDDETHDSENDKERAHALHTMPLPRLVLATSTVVTGTGVHSAAAGGVAVQGFAAHTAGVILPACGRILAPAISLAVNPVFTIHPTVPAFVFPDVRTDVAGLRPGSRHIAPAAPAGDHGPVVSRSRRVIRLTDYLPQILRINQPLLLHLLEEPAPPLAVLLHRGDVIPR